MSLCQVAVCVVGPMSSPTSPVTVAELCWHRPRTILTTLFWTEVALWDTVTLCLEWKWELPAVCCLTADEEQRKGDSLHAAMLPQTVLPAGGFVMNCIGLSLLLRRWPCNVTELAALPEQKAQPSPAGRAHCCCPVSLHGCLVLLLELTHQRQCYFFVFAGAIWFGNLWMPCIACHVAIQTTRQVGKNNNNSNNNINLH